MKKYEELRHYRFFDYDNGEGEPLTAIELLIKEYEGVLYHYGKVQLIDEGEFNRMKFDFVILHPGEHELAVLEQDEKFVTIMGDILTELIMKKYNETGTDDTQKFNV